ncbi:hypothetical protein N7G274_006139 [Stereocaulon virgatum]|uniref:FAD dependent oxidoreductase domain-containing protein n=1 Tax=Stereocaulon virgatum TaxID=373712 RepID=A0ABR4A8X2_9LECA
MMSSLPPSSYLIIGAGVFGASTALHLKRSDSTATISLVDGGPLPNTSAASHDINKIIRADYEDVFWMRIALEAIHQWKNNPIYKPYYHKTGMVYAEDMGIARKVIENFKTLCGASPSNIMSVEEAKSSFNGVFSDGNWTGVKESYWSPETGWAEADHALKSVIQAALDHGVSYRESAVQKLIIDKHGICSGIITESGTKMMADHIILCTGARTAQLLASSAPHNKDIQTGGRLVAAGAVSCAARLPAPQRDLFQAAPVLFNAMEHTRGESLGPTKDGVLKFNSELSFTNNVYHEESDQMISIPPTAQSQRTWSQDVPQILKDDVRRVMTNTYGKQVEGIEVESYRMCWDSLTPNQDWILSPHPKVRNLYIAAGGSFHSWKFLPVIGSCVVKMLRGELDQEHARRWGWDRRDEGGANTVYEPGRDLGDITTHGDAAG